MARARKMAGLAGRSAWQALRAFLVGDHLTHAASIAYYSLLSLFPIFLLTFAFLGVVTTDVQNRTVVLDFALRYFPRQFEFITSQLDAFQTSRVSLGVGGTLALVWGALGVFGAISTAVDYAWGAPEQGGYWRHKLVSFAMLGVAGVLLLVALLLVSASHLVGAMWFAGVLKGFPGLDVLGSFAVRSATTLLFIAVVGCVYYFVPRAPVRFRDVWLGATIAGLLWKGAFEIFSWYMRDLGRLTRVNGSMATVVVFLIWVYTQAAILLYGVEFTVAYARLRRDDIIER